MGMARRGKEWKIKNYTKEEPVLIRFAPILWTILLLILGIVVSPSLGQKSKSVIPHCGKPFFRPNW